MARLPPSGCSYCKGGCSEDPHGAVRREETLISRFWVFLVNEQLDVKVTFIFFEI